ncbi:OLC1v1022120C1 [Oldenlandia corymbosa var. corymbosa]|uniref:OLC1v1022120C1 n=1 Tax=Oldenlandia corymbosa var. corymbosa TaxID=529605 RepID=A0AAV1BX57_OLDCO|nr:OLC1v1022120C1 [Oldenlandia corymbosa var. corymbosa]
METEPLLPIIHPRGPLLSPPPSLSPLTLCPLPENDEITVPPPYPMTPSELKDRLVFGFSPSPSSSSLLRDSACSSSLLDALNLNTSDYNSPRTIPTSPFSASDVFAEKCNLEPQIQQQQAWLTDPTIPSRGKIHRSKTAPAMAGINEVLQSSVPKAPPILGQSQVRQAVVLLIVYLTLGVIIYSLNRHHFKARETHPVVDALYFCIVTMCTIGYGDITPDNPATKLFSILFVLVGFGFLDIWLSGMVAYVLDLQERYLLRRLKSGDGSDPGRFLIDVKKGRMRIRMKVALALIVVIICIGVGVAVMHYVEKLGWLDSFYLSVMSVTTVGYGDRAFESLPGRIFASVWLLVSTLAVARAFLYLAEFRVEKRNRMMAKVVLGEDMNVDQFLDSGFVTKSEYVLYKLKAMKKVSEIDVMQICKQFERLDTGNCGKIHLSALSDH